MSVPGEPLTSGRPERPSAGQSAIAYVFSPPVFKRSLTIALVVGSILSIANQYDVLARTPMNARLGVKLLFNFLVPFTVASASAVLNRKRT
jgi:hypothetical protein